MYGTVVLGVQGLQWGFRASQVYCTSPSFRPSPVHAQSCPLRLHSISTHHRQKRLLSCIVGSTIAQSPNPNPNLNQALSSHSLPISTLGMLVNDFSLVNLLLVPWQSKLFSRGPFAVTFPFNFADALASFAFVVFGEFNKVEDVFLFVGGRVSSDGRGGWEGGIHSANKT